MLLQWPWKQCELTFLGMSGRMGKGSSIPGARGLLSPAWSPGSRYVHCGVKGTCIVLNQHVAGLRKTCWI